MGMKTTGMDAVKAKLRVIQRNFPERVEAALFHEAAVEMTEAQRRTPVWNPERPVPKGVTPGLLRASGHVEAPVRKGTLISVTLAFGGNGAEAYALYVHEDLDAYHATGQAKYLESVLRESAPYIPQRIAARIKLE